jgi:hypothetical protein
VGHAGNLDARRRFGALEENRYDAIKQMAP